MYISTAITMMNINKCRPQAVKNMLNMITNLSVSAMLKFEKVYYFIRLINSVVLSCLYVEIESMQH